MNARMDTIKRLAESDPYWRGYLDGMTAAHHDNSAAHEYARLAQARLARAVDDAAQRSEFHTVDEVRARLNERRARNADTTDYDSEWTRNEVAVSPHSEETRRARDMSEAMLGRMDFALDTYRSRTVDREHVMARRLGLPYPARLDVDPR